MGRHEARTSPCSGLSTPAIILVGLLLSTAILTSILLIRYMTGIYSPSLANAERLIERGRYDEALAVVGRIQEQGQTDARIKIIEGKAWLAKAWEIQEKNGWKEFGTDQGRWMPGPEAQRAVELLRDALQSDPDHVEAHLWLATATRELGWFTEAEEHYLRAIELNADYLDAHIGLGVLYSRMDRLADAEQTLQAAYELQPHNADVAKNLAFLYRYYLAQPESAMVWFNRYLNWSSQRDTDVNLAKKELEELLARYPEFTLEEEQAWRAQKRKFVPRSPSR